jgi:hypothetical protein
VRLAAPGIEGEVAGQQRATDALGDAGIVVQRHAGLAATHDQCRITVVDQGAQRRRFMDWHRTIVPSRGDESPATLHDVATRDSLPRGYSLLSRS